MIPTEEQLPPPPQPPQPNRNSTSCDRHPEEHFTGFCPSCLCERLAVLDQSSSASTSSGRKSTSSTIKSIFRVSTNTTVSTNKNNHPVANGPTFRNKSGTFFPELRRTKSFSGGKNEGFGFSGIFEPQRKSCDVRVRNTLGSLFSQNDEKSTVVVAPNNKDKDATNLGPSSSSSCVAAATVLEFKEEQLVNAHKVEKDEDRVEEEVIDDEIEVLDEPISSSNNSDLKCFGGREISGEEEISGEVKKVDLKPMKDHIDLDSHNKKVGSKDFKDLAGSFWSAASVFSKKFKAWTRKHHKMKKNGGPDTAQVAKKINAARNNYRDTQSEIADYGFGRRSCDTDPRFSLDAGRMSLDAGRFSLDDRRYSFDEPRASWDGYLIGRTLSRMPPMLSVVEDAPAVVVVPRKDNQIPLEEQPSMNSTTEEEIIIPGGASETKDYYSDSSSRRRKSLDRSSSIRKTAAAAVVSEMDEMKSNSKGNVSPTAVDYFHGAKIGDKESRESNPESIFVTGFRDNSCVINNGERKGANNKTRRWKAWNIWGLIYRRGGNNKDEDEDRFSRPNGVERSLSESWQELRRGDGYGVDARGSFNRNVFRSNSSVSWRSSYNIMGGGSFGSLKKNGVERNGHSRKKRDEFVLERNQSARYSPSHVDNSLLRFYWTPLRGSRRGGSSKAKPTYSHSFSRSALRLY
ncbi:hypothetical protein Nepgr_030965 [Nepenthes gracilis]|uniref:Uncharacterized protein n=1 Tax=Nepenthes gracilis TaxID=150966 RepID=A0AAD3TGN7_NEPGR|nr:hypothetical protein Nepgr_030965 [Nepenthes gracilis]